MRYPSNSPGSIRLRDVRAYVIPTTRPEADGTLEWNTTTLVVVETEGMGKCGLGYTYAHRAAIPIIVDVLAAAIEGIEPMDIPRARWTMQRAVRNLGRVGLCAMAISAVDIALWDLKAKILDVPVTSLLGRVREAVPVYGSGGFISDTDGELREELTAWREQGFKYGKIKIGKNEAQDLGRLATARQAIGPSMQLFVDANGAYTPKQALSIAEKLVDHAVCWFEEPVSSEDLNGLALLRERAPAQVRIAAGEYAYTLEDFGALLRAQAVDVLQADATRCGGISGFLAAATLAQTFGVPLSAHTAPSVHVHPCCAVEGAEHIEYFRDHARIEQSLFDGAPIPKDGKLYPQTSVPGLGLLLKRRQAEQFRV